MSSMPMGDGWNPVYVVLTVDYCSQKQTRRVSASPGGIGGLSQPGPCYESVLREQSASSLLRFEVHSGVQM